MDGILLDTAFILILLAVNAIFSMSEMAIVSARKARLRRLADDGSRGASEALYLASSPGRFLSTIQIGMTLVGVLSGAFAGATISEEIGGRLTRQFGLSIPLGRGLGVVLMVTVITFLFVIFGELVPKRIALKFPERIAALTAIPMTLISKVSAPVVWLFSSATDLILKLLRLDKGAIFPGVTHDEIRAIVDQGAEEGVIEKHEKMMFTRVLTFAKTRVNAIMTPAREIVWIDNTKAIDAELERILDTNFSSYPVANGGLDRLLGTVKSKDFCRFASLKQTDISRIIIKPVYIPETSNALQVLDLFRKTGIRIGFVIDEFGSVLGLLTMTNIIRIIFGDLPVSGTPVEEPITIREDGSWLVDGGLPLESLKELLGISRKIHGEEQNLFRTVAGFVMYHMGRLPGTADVLIWERWRFEIVDMDKQRIDKVSISLTQTDQMP